MLPVTSQRLTVHIRIVCVIEEPTLALGVLFVQTHFFCFHLVPLSGFARETGTTFKCDRLLRKRPPPPPSAPPPLLPLRFSIQMRSLQLMGGQCCPEIKICPSESRCVGARSIVNLRVPPSNSPNPLPSDTLCSFVVFPSVKLTFPTPGEDRVD